MSKPEKESATIVDLGFSVADANLRSVSTSEEGLVIRIRDWRQEIVEAIFVDAVSYQWEMIERPYLKGERFDCCHTIENSEWLAKHLAQREIFPNDGYRHYRLNFNVGGTLEVIARDVRARTVQADAGKSDPSVS